MKFLQKLVFAISLIILGSVQAMTFSKVQLPHSTISFIFKQMGVAIEGKFSEFKVQLQFDPAKSETAQAQIEIALNSIDAGSTEANDEVKGKNWFNATVFPTAKFVSTSVKALDDNRYEVIGNLTIKGKTNPVTAPFTFKLVDKTGYFEGSFILKRLQFNLGEGSWADTETVADDIQIRFKFIVLPDS